MNKKDSLLIRRVISDPEQSCVLTCASCYVDVNSKDIWFQSPRTFLNIEERQMEIYASHLKKGLTGKIGSTLIELRPDENLLEELRDTKLRDETVIKNAADKIVNSYVTEENYSIFFAYGEYDVPAEDGYSDEVYSYILVMIQPCILNKPGIKFDKPNNEFSSNVLDRMLSIPQYTFVYPSFDEGHTDMGTAVVYTKNEKLVTAANDLVLTIFGTVIPLPPNTQKEVFQDMLVSAYAGEVPYSAINQIYDNLAEKIVDSEMAGVDAELSASEVAKIILDSNDDMEAAKKMKDTIMQTVADHPGCKFSAQNLVSNKVSIESNGIIIKADRLDVFSVEKRVIDGREYYLVPAHNSSVDGIAVLNQN